MPVSVSRPDLKKTLYDLWQKIKWYLRENEHTRRLLREVRKNSQHILFPGFSELPICSGTINEFGGSSKDKQEPNKLSTSFELL